MSFPEAAEFVLNNPEWVLCHGVINNHSVAWAERNDLVQFWQEKGTWVSDRVWFYKIFAVIGKKEYSRKEAVRLMVGSEHYGPWEET